MTTPKDRLAAYMYALNKLDAYNHSDGICYLISYAYMNISFEHTFAPCAPENFPELHKQRPLISHGFVFWFTSLPIGLYQRKQALRNAIALLYKNHPFL